LPPRDLRGIDLMDSHAESVADALGPRLQVRMTGVYGPEESGRWTNAMTAIATNRPVPSRQVSLGFVVYNPADSRVRLRINDTVVADITVGPGAYAKDFPTFRTGLAVVVNSNTFLPHQVGLNADERTLGIYLRSVVLR